MSLDVVKVVFNDEHENHNPIISQAHLKFPPDYPYNPPSIRFLSKVWHPNVYEVIHILKNPFEEEKTLTLQNGDLCVSILHPPVDDPQSGELPCERWNPTQNVRTILLSVVRIPSSATHLSFYLIFLIR